MSSLPKVLIVEDEAAYQNAYLETLKGWAEIIPVYGLQEAELLFEAHQDVSVIIMDDCLRSGVPNTLQLVKKIRESGYTGKIIATARDQEHNRLLLEAGCTHKSGKREAGMLARVLLPAGATK